ncbi:MAG: hypothetical protein ACI9BW_000118 [Gammaproteobacteria bacterium]|jgi:hypothetical protein
MARTVANDIGSLARAFWEICCLKRAPQDLPASRFLFNCTLLSYVVLGTAINLIGFGFAEACSLSLAMTALLLVSIRLLLQIRGYRARLQQTATAMMGASIVLFVPAVVLRYWFHLIELNGSESNLAGYIWVALFVWQLFISANIFKHALGMRLLGGFFISIAYVLLEFRVMFFVHQSFA